MTGWTIRAGYQYDTDPTDVADTLVEVASNLTPEDIAKRASVDVDFVRQYLDPSGCALNVREDDETGHSYVSLVASGGGTSRGKKEACARGICLLLLEWAHGNGHNLTVTCS